MKVKSCRSHARQALSSHLHISLLVSQAHLADLKERLKNVRANADKLRTEVQLTKTAIKVGCKKEELVGTKVVCPPGRLGEIIGKKGSHVKQLQASASVTVNVLQQGDVRIVGSLEALDAATSNLLKVIDSVEECVENPDPALVAYLTCKHVTALKELAERHPHVRISIKRHPNVSVTLKGLPEDVNRLRTELMDMAVVVNVLELSDSEISATVGKQGATVEGLVVAHQAVIDVERSSAPKDEKKDSDEKGNNKKKGKSRVTITGPQSHVELAAAEVERLASQVREVTHSIAIDPVAKNAMLVNTGAGIQALTKLLNDGKPSGFVYASFDGNHVVLRGRAQNLPDAVSVAEAEIRRVEALTVRITVDPVVVPTLIGKGGETIKAIRDGKPVVVDVDDSGKVVVGGCDQSHVEAAAQAVRDVLAGNAVTRTSVDAATYKRVALELVRTKSRTINGLCKLSLDDDKCQVVLRGDPDKVAEAEAIVNEFLMNNCVEEVAVTDEDLAVLLAGGKNSKIAELAASLEVNLSADRVRNVVEVRGVQDKVLAAVKALKQFLFGGDGITVLKVVLSGQVLGMVIGKGGKNKVELQKKFPNVSITVESATSTLTLRGPEAEAESCRVEVLKLVAGAQVSESISISSKLHERFSTKTKPRDILRDIPVQITLSDDSIKVRGYAPDVRDAVALLNESIHGKYESRMALSSPQFAQVKNACRHQSSPLQRAMDTSGASVVLDSSDEAIVFRGKRSQVKAAKLELFSFFDFLFGSSFSRMELAVPVLPTVGRMAVLSEISAVSGSTIQLDRDTSFLLVFSNDSDSMEKATSMLKGKIEEACQLFFELQLEPSEDWIVSSIIGKKGDQISKLRKSTKCEIDVDSAARTVLVKSKSAELTSHARSTLEELVEKLRRENVLIAMSNEDISAFIGRAGAKIAEFSDKYEVEAKVQRNTSPASIRITGSESAVAAAKAAALDWLKERDDARKEAETVETLRIRRDQVPVVIGTKGATIRSLQSEAGCKVEVDRDALIVSVRGGNAEKRKTTLDKIKAVLSEARDMAAQADEDEQGEDEHVVAPAGDSSSSQEPVKPTPTADDSTPAKPSRPVAIAAAPPKKLPQPSDFPELVATPARKEAKCLSESDVARQSSPPEIMSSTTCSTVDSSKDDGEEDESPRMSWSHVVASRPPAEAAAGAGERRCFTGTSVVHASDQWGDADSVASGDEKPFPAAIPSMTVIEP